MKGERYTGGLRIVRAEWYLVANYSLSFMYCAPRPAQIGGGKKVRVILTVCMLDSKTSRLSEGTIL